ncbi:MAG: hypothetical protein DHS20C18_13670 [Saprospiraceae bacterium]|nr:MAG: hypothetical protein DHS20C18_13670 [Saprospiraceae bacterium]
MKKANLLILLFSCVTFSLSAQLWLEVGGKAMFGLTGYLNSNIANDNSHEYKLNTALTYGGVVGLNIGDHSGINIEALFTKHQQDITFLDNLVGENFVNSLEWDALDLYLLYRFYTNGGAFFELGPKMTAIREIDQTFGPTRLDTEGKYEDTYYSAVAGLGSFLFGSEISTFKIGMRLEYALTDMVSSEGEKDGFPAFYRSYDSYKPTNPFRATIYLELSFGVGGIAKSTCGRRGFVFGSRYR